MSHSSPSQRWLGAALLAVTALGVSASPTAAAPTKTTLTHECAFPLIGIQPVSTEITTDVADHWLAKSPTEKSPLGVVATLGGDVARMFGTLNGATTVKAVGQARLDVEPPAGTSQSTFPITVGLTATPQPFVSPSAGGPTAVGLDLAGELPSLTFDDPGIAAYALSSVRLNLQLLNATGTPFRMPAAKDFEGLPVIDSDADPDTFDVVCRLKPTTQNTQVATQTIVVNGADTTPPSTPGEVALLPSDVGATSVNLKWGASTDEVGGSGLKGYTIDLGDQQLFVPAGTTSKRIEGLGPDSPLSFFISAVDNAGNESEPLEISIPICSGAPLGPPTSVIPPPVVGTPTSAIFFWGPPLNLGGACGSPVLDRYRLVVDGRTFEVPAGTTSKTVTGLQPGTTYTGQVSAVDTSGAQSESIDVVAQTLPAPEPERYRYSFKGSTALKTLTKGTLPLSGGFVTDANPWTTGAFTADLTLNPTTGRLVALGALPLTAKIGFAVSGKTTATLKDGVLTTNSKVRIKVQEVKLFGAIPLVAGNSCQTKQLSDITLTSTEAFIPLTGGTIAGTFKISDLNGCGALNGLVSPLVAGAGNSISLLLSPGL